VTVLAIACSTISACDDKVDKVGEGEKKASKPRSASRNRSSAQQETFQKFTQYHAYMQELQGLVKADWQPPEGKQGIYGICQYIVERSGKIRPETLKIRRTSGDKSIDAAMLQCLAKVDGKLPLPRLPAKRAPSAAMIVFSFNPALMTASPREAESEMQARLRKMDESLAKADDPALVFARARLLANLQQYDRAITDLDSLQQSGFRPVDCLVEMGKIQYRRKQYGQALEMLDRALELDERNVYALIPAAACLQNLEQHKFALKYLDKAIDLARENPLPMAEALASRAFSYIAMGNFKRALADCRLAISKDLWHVPAYVYAGDAEYGLSHLKEAEKLYTLALDLNPEDMDTWLRRGQIYLETGKFSQAITDFGQALQISPNDGKALYLRSLANKELGFEGQASSDLERAKKAGFVPQ
jgi:tetratricopeptide (TPR) repeat protein